MLLRDCLTFWLRLAPQRQFGFRALLGKRLRRNPPHSMFLKPVARRSIGLSIRLNLETSGIAGSKWQVLVWNSQRWRSSIASGS